MLLSILLPSYNRMNYLLLNVDRLIAMIEESGKKKDIELIISLNKANIIDIKTLRDKYDKYDFIKLYFHKRLLSPSEHCRFVLTKAVGSYCMFQGDDDFLTDNYFYKMLKFIEDDTIGLVIGNYYSINEKFEKTGYQRDKEHEVERIKKRNFRYLFYCTQMTGITFQKRDLSKIIENKNISNLYIHVFMAAYNILLGDTIYISDSPYAMMNTSNRGWKYSGDNGLFDIINNFKFLDICYLERLKLEIKLFKNQSNRLKYSLKKKGFILDILRNKDITLLFKLIFSMLYPVLLVRVNGRDLV